ncbi:MAG: hypothetical protein H6828_03555 [Planctomycetes bacterium]|nr:hypothetical protein [Planctomycetota bacterium]
MTHPIIKRDQVHVHASAAPAKGAAPRVIAEGGGCTAPGEKGVRLLRDGADVRAIEFTCSCGEVTVIELRYQGDPTA